METKTNEEKLNELKSKIEEIKELHKGMGKGKADLLLLTKIDCGDHYDSGIVVCGSIFSIAKMFCETAGRDEFVNKLLNLLSHQPPEMLILEKLQEMLMGEKPEPVEKEVSPDKDSKDVSIPGPEPKKTK